LFPYYIVRFKPAIGAYAVIDPPGSFHTT